jgi:hypothetical protein
VHEAPLLFVIVDVRERVATARARRHNFNVQRLPSPIHPFTLLDSRVNQLPSALDLPLAEVVTMLLAVAV